MRHIRHIKKIDLHSNFYCIVLFNICKRSKSNKYESGLPTA